MPAGVSVVIRARRRSFALLLAAPAWIGSAWAAFRRRPPTPTAKDSGAAGFQTDAGIPALRFSPDGDHRCTACGVCIEICPSRALSQRVARTTQGSGLVEITGFELDVGGCIGCGRCVEDCPEDALATRRTPAVAIALGSGYPEPVDLLDAGGLPR